MSLTPPDVLRLTWNITIQPLPQTLHTLGLISQRTEARLLRFLLFPDRTIFVQVMDGDLGARVPLVSAGDGCPGYLAVAEREAEGSGGEQVGAGAGAGAAGGEERV